MTARREPTDEELENVVWLTEESWVPDADARQSGGVQRAPRVRPHDHTFRSDELWAAAALAFVVLLAMAGMALAGGAR